MQEELETRFKDESAPSSEWTAFNGQPEQVSTEAEAKSSKTVTNVYSSDPIETAAESKRRVLLQIGRVCEKR